MQLGRGHTKGDTVAWLPQQKILFSGDLVEYGATAYAGDAYFTDWPATLDKARGPRRRVAIVPGRGAALTDAGDVPRRCRHHARLHRMSCSRPSSQGVAQGHDLQAASSPIPHAALTPVATAQQFIYEHCMPFDVSRAFDEASAHRDPRIWTAERDQEMWATLA